MTRLILCAQCAAKHPSIHPEDAAIGFKRRMVRGIGKKPDNHAIEIFSAGKRLSRTDIPSLLCDCCNEDLPDGSEIVCVTMWRGAEPGGWEDEYLQTKGQQP